MPELVKLEPDLVFLECLILTTIILNGVILMSNIKIREMEAFLSVKATKSDGPAVSLHPQHFTELSALQKPLTETRE